MTPPRIARTSSFNERAYLIGHPYVVVDSLECTMFSGLSPPLSEMRGKKSSSIRYRGVDPYSVSGEMES